MGLYTVLLHTGTCDTRFKTGVVNVCLCKNQSHISYYSGSIKAALLERAFIPILQNLSLICGTKLQSFIPIEVIFKYIATNVTL